MVYQVVLRGAIWITMTVLLIIPYHKCERVMKPEERKVSDELGDVGYVDEVGHCLRDGGGVNSCLTAGAFVFLESAAQRRNFAITEGLEFHENDLQPQETRTSFPLPIGENGQLTDFSTLLEASTRFLQKRTLHWSLDFLYPGLKLCVGPTTTGPPTLHFLLDPRQGADERRLTTGRLLVKRAILPYILGMKLNLVTIMPLIFAALIVLTKKAFILSKFAFLFMALMGFSTASHLTQHHQSNPVAGYGFNSGGGIGTGSGFDSPYLKDFDRSTYNKGESAGRNFIWEEKEKKTSREEREKKIK